MPCKLWKTRAEQPACTLRRDTLKYNITEEIESTSTRTTGCLAEVQGSQKDGVTTEDHRGARHIDTQTQRPSSNNNSQKAFSEQHLHALSVLSVHTSVMHANSSTQKPNELFTNPFTTKLPFVFLELHLWKHFGIGKTKFGLRCLRIK